MYGIHGTLADRGLQALGFKPMKRCLLFGFADGDYGYAKNVDRVIRRVCASYPSMDVSLLPITQKWERGRFRDPYLREDLQDYGILIDTLECAVTWSQMEDVHKNVRSFIKSHPDTICMTHLSHTYPQGGNLYFIFISKMDSIQKYLEMQYGILETISQSGAAMSHHHGIGKQTAPWLEAQIGSPSMAILRAIKQHFDPDFLMNPGGTLGMDMTAEQTEKRWGLHTTPE
jgi:alkyldihydroxyacetonephosphate synthase